MKALQEQADLEEMQMPCYKERCTGFVVMEFYLSGVSFTRCQEYPESIFL